MFDAQLAKVFAGEVRLNSHEMSVDLAGMKDLVDAIEKDHVNGETNHVPKEYNAVARTLMNAYRKPTIRVQEFPSLKQLKDSMAKTFGKIDLTIISSGGYLDREPFMAVP